MKLLTTLVVAAQGQNYDYDFYSSGEAYRFGSVGAGSITTGSKTAGSFVSFVSFVSFFLFLCL